MTPESLQKVAELFHQAHKRQGAERHAFLAEACGDDAALRAEMRRCARRWNRS